LVSGGFRQLSGSDAVLKHPDTGITVYFLPPDPGKNTTSTWQVGDVKGKGYASLKEHLNTLSNKEQQTTPKPEPKPEPEAPVIEQKQQVKKPAPSVEHSSWTSEKTTSEGFVKNHGVGIHYDPNSGLSEKVFIEKAKQLDIALTGLKSRFPEMKDISSLGNLRDGFRVANTRELGKGVGAVYEYVRGGIAVSDRLKPGFGELRRGRFSVGGNNLDTCVMHEIGHVLHLSDKIKVTQIGDRRLIDDWKKVAPQIEKDISKYAATNKREYIAEAFAAYTHPDYGKGDRDPVLPPGLVKQFEALLGKRA
jgi:hypothetical protein